jgi:hypothetical protein
MHEAAIIQNRLEPLDETVTRAAWSARTDGMMWRG